MHSFFNLLKNCAICRSVKPNFGELCQSCHRKWLRSLQPQFCKEYDFSLVTGGPWTDCRYQALWIYQQKGGKLPLTSRMIVEKMGEELGYPPPGTTFIPVPGGRHAHALAAYLAAKSGGFYFDKLLKTQGKSQKSRSRSQRQKISVINRTSTSLGYIVLVDDIVASGSTVRACRKALGYPRQFEVWSLFFRPMSLIREHHLRRF